ncbi:hypothetical protein PHAVU_009G042600 [Phaseolus vulgaris]|uniref:Uncharacterized protein n=1 Tax=Phaseolus vulgaris TaxID=3885 RepID=V7AUY1_PHAVU|nr:hypothetical protein PHAVU_009G042600g [Phaseolus vulgaris]ESW08403.1 hypothetical protein PHAVU_009G042600g [Phaseolus vulgaris]
MSVRVVRCPKCRLLLEEPTGCDLYKCGECGTILEAKKRTSVTVNLESSTQETIAATRKHLVPSRECSLKEKSTSSAECVVDGNSGRGQLVPFILSDEGQETESDIYNLSHRRHRMSSKGCSTSNKTTQSEIEEVNEGKLLEELREELVCAQDEDGYNDRSASTLIRVTSEKKNTEVDLEGVEEFISETDRENANKNKSVVVAALPEVEITESVDSEEAEELNGGNLSSDEAEEEFSSALEEEDANNYKSSPVGENLELKITESNRAEELNDGKLFEGAEHAPDGEDFNNNPSAIDGAKPEVDTTESASTTIRSSTEEDNILHVTPDKLEGPPANLVSSHKQQKQAQKDVHRGFDRVRSVHTTELIDHSSELSDILVGKLSKSPTARSSHAYYNGSLSSYDAMDERSPIKHSGPFDYTHTIGNDVSEGRTRKGKGLVNNLFYGGVGTQRQSHLTNAKHHAKKDGWGNQSKAVEETTRNGHRHWKSRQRDEFPPKIPFHRGGSRSYYERGSSSDHMHGEIHRSSSFLSHESFEETDPEKMKLLSMIHKLQDQLNRTSYSSGEINGRLSKGVSYKGNRIPAYHTRDFDEARRFSHGLDYPLCNGRCSHGVNWHQRHNQSSLPYSAEATSSALHVDHSCYHCRSQERHFSADISPHVRFQHERIHRSCAGRDCCSFSHHSYPSSPQWFTDSKLPPMYGRETKSDDQRRRVPELSRYLREKRNLVAKRHHRPVAGGAPFVTCHKCLNLLQLPADFLLFKRACHQLKCGECSEVLKFSLHGSHIDLFSPNNATGHPSSDLNDQSQVISSSSLPSASHAKYYRYSPAGAISYYDDYGLSISKSYSSEGEPISLAHSHHLHGSEYDNSRVSRGIFEPSTEKENIAPRYSSARKSSEETDESAIFPTNMSGSRKLASEMRAKPPPKSSSLHLLMGYSSPSQVYKRASDFC